MRNPEGVGSAFDLETFLRARKVAQKIVFLFASHMKEGVSETRAHEILEEMFQRNGVHKKWHPSKIRFGSNTVKSFREKSEPDAVLKKEDIYFVDIGPVIDGHEADYGQTFTLGQNPEYSKIQKATRDVFQRTASVWKNEGLSGKALYEKASLFAKEAGYELNTAMKGHRVGDFPHALYYKKSLADFEARPVENLWILEILLKHPSQKFGAFFEDVLSI